MDIDRLGSTPIPGNTPAGHDARYEPEFGLLQAEIDKLSSASAGGAIDWNRVVELASQILSSKAKDLMAAAYLGVGLMHTRGVEGVRLGACILRDICNTFWDDCFPAKKRMRGRMAAFTWWQEKTTAWLKNATIDPLSTEAHTALTRAVRDLDAQLRELLPDFPPMRDLMEMVGRIPEVAPPPQEAAPPPIPQGSEPAPAGPPQSPSPQPQTPPEDTASARRQLADAAVTFAALAAQEDPKNPWPWRASRLAAWIGVRTLPPAEDGATLIPPPEPTIKAALLAQLTEGKLLEAALAAEAQVPASLFWLDLHRIVAQALERLGPEFSLALDAVRTEVRLFLARLPGVERLAFADGTPFADAETRSWIASLTTPATPETPAATRAEGDELQTALAEAEKRVAAKDEAGALDVLGMAARSSPHGPTRLRCTLAQMGLLGRLGRTQAAVALAEAVLTIIDHHGLEAWDPDLAVEALLALHAAFVAHEKAESAKAVEMARRIACLKPSAILTIE